MAQTTGWDMAPERGKEICHFLKLRKTLRLPGENTDKLALTTLLSTGPPPLFSTPPAGGDLPPAGQDAGRAGPRAPPNGAARGERGPETRVVEDEEGCGRSWRGDRPPLGPGQVGPNHARNTALKRWRRERQPANMVLLKSTQEVMEARRRRIEAEILRDHVDLQAERQMTVGYYHLLCSIYIITSLY
ncbi:hypothetical protein N7465_006400 [Penicillium sp. CMV-2018d]|nr:hypothetical protein N7465_006400 [Penicillium sp. CMV-2018d]